MLLIISRSRSKMFSGYNSYSKCLFGTFHYSICGSAGSQDSTILVNPCLYPILIAVIKNHFLGH